MPPPAHFNPSGRSNAHHCTFQEKHAMSMATPETQNGWFTRERVLVLALAAVTVGAFYLCYRLALPFVPAITWALAIAVVAHPLHRWMHRRLSSKSLAAGLTVLIVTVTLLAPAVFVVQQATSDAISSAEGLKEAVSDGRWREAVGKNAFLSSALDWIEREVNVKAQLEKLAADVLEGAKKFVSGSIYAATGMLIMLFLLYYFFRDQDKMLGGLRKSFPLSPRETDRVFHNVRDAIYAVVYGTLLLAVVQGTLGGLMFWALGLPAPLLWGAVMALLAVLPVLGAAIVWVPAAIYLAVTGSWEKALILTAWGGIVVALIDNLLYPIIVKDRLRLHTVPVFIAVIGGLMVFGMAGIVLGPVVLVIASVLADVWRRRMAQGDAVENSTDAEKAADVVESRPRRSRAAR
jgi:predicted PurR-regulated permease PerM